MPTRKKQTATASAPFEVDLNAFTLSLIGANITNHSHFYRNALWECVPDGGCPGLTIGGLTPNGYAYWHPSEGPSERKIETFEVRAIQRRGRRFPRVDRRRMVREQKPPPLGSVADGVGLLRHLVVRRAALDAGQVDYRANSASGRASRLHWLLRRGDS